MAFSLLSLVLIIIFAVIYEENFIANQVKSIVDFCDRKPVLITVMIIFEAVFLRAEPSYFGFIGTKIANYFCF